MADRANTEALFGKTLNADGTLRAVSPSQIITFKRCGLRWHFDKKGKLQKKPMGKGASIGDAAHGRTEKFLNTGQDVRGPLELIGAKMLEPYLWAAPFNKGPGVVEGALLDPRLQTPGGILITGYFDYYIPGVASEHFNGLTWPTIIDHKFKKDLEKWADTEEELEEDPQATCYMTWALMKQPDTDGAIFRHHNVQTEGPGGRYPLPVEIRATRDTVLRRFGALAAVIDGPMLAASKVPAAMPGATPEGVPFNDMACGDFGGCDFARTCRHSPMNKFTALLRDSGAPLSNAPFPVSNKPTTYTEVNPMGLLNALNEEKKGGIVPQTAGSTPQTAPAMVTALKDSIVAAGGMVELPVSQAKAGTVYLIPPTASPARFEGAIGSRAIFRDKAGGLREVDAGANVRTVDEETLCLFEGRKYEKPAVQVVTATPNPVANAMVTQAADQESKAEKARKLGIVYVDEKPGVGVVPPDVGAPVAPAQPAPTEVKVTTAEAIATPPAQPAEQTEKKPRGKKAAASAPTGEAPEPMAGKLMLLVNCGSRHATDLAGYVKGLADALAQKHGAPDVRLGHKNSDLGFGGWKALLAIEATKAPPSGLCSIRSGELADPVIEALIPMAAVVVNPEGR